MKTFTFYSLAIMTSIVSAQSPTAAKPARKDQGGRGFTVEMNMATRLMNDGGPSNVDIAGVHLHTGSPVVNGPVAVIFCGSAPLPEALLINGRCNTTAPIFHAGSDGLTFAEQQLVANSSVGAWNNGCNKAMSVQGAKTLATGASSTSMEFLNELESCTADMCNIYLNIHTIYSFMYNPGAYGVARAQLQPVDCPADRAAPGVQCFGSSGYVSSDNTNMVMGLPHQLPAYAGAATALIGDVLVTYYGNGYPYPTTRSLRGGGN